MKIAVLRPSRAQPQAAVRFPGAASCRNPSRPDDLLQVAGDNGVELVERQIDAMIGDAILREVVGADAFAAVAGADQRAALLGPFLVQRLLLAFVQPAAEDAHGPVVVLVLAAFVLALDFHLFGGALLVPDAARHFRSC